MPVGCSWRRALEGAVAKYIERGESPGSLPELYYEPSFTAAAEKIAAKEQAKVAA